MREIKGFGERDSLKLRIVIVIESLALSYNEGLRPFVTTKEGHIVPRLSTCFPEFWSGRTISVQISTNGHIALYRVA